MRQYPIRVALVCGVATLGTVSVASADCGCGVPAAYPVAVVAEPVLIAAPVPVYVVNQGQFPYLHGADFYNRRYYSNGPYGNPAGYRGFYHPYARIDYSGLPGEPRIGRVGPDYVRARHQPVWRLAHSGHPWHGPYRAPLRPQDK